MDECDEWLSRLTIKYGLPRAVLVKMLDRPGALEYEAGMWIAEHAVVLGKELFMNGGSAPEGDDLWARAKRAVYERLVAERDAAEEAARLARYTATDDYIRRLKAGEDV